MPFSFLVLLPVCLLYFPSLFPSLLSLPLSLWMFVDIAFFTCECMMPGQSGIPFVCISAWMALLPLIVYGTWYIFVYLVVGMFSLGPQKSVCVRNMGFLFVFICVLQCLCTPWWFEDSECVPGYFSLSLYLFLPAPLDASISPWYDGGPGSPPHPQTMWSLVCNPPEGCVFIPHLLSQETRVFPPSQIRELFKLMPIG